MNIPLISKPFKVLSEVLKNRLTTGQHLFYVTEAADWAIKDTGKTLMKHLSPNFRMTPYPYGIRNSIVHYGSITTFLTGTRVKPPHKSNSIIVTWFHITPDDKRLAYIKEALRYKPLWHTASNDTRDKLVKAGIPEERIIVIPLGVDLSLFHPSTEVEKKGIRRELNLPEDAIIIGSFQKDGNGWDEGLSPKLIKGPDIFCDVIEELSEKYNVYVLLTGPARGYVKKRLDEASVPYLHHYLDDPEEIAKYYKAIDLYLVTSRVEGGPKAVLESLACGVPLVTTKVGLAPDVIKEGENGLLVDIEDRRGIIAGAEKILNDGNLRSSIIKNGLKSIKDYSWGKISEEYSEKLYS